jgi:hypothetical protein
MENTQPGLREAEGKTSQVEEEKARLREETLEILRSKALVELIGGYAEGEYAYWNQAHEFLESGQIETAKGFIMARIMLLDSIRRLVALIRALLNPD